MAQPGESRARFESRYESGGPVVRRSWKLVAGPGGPLLTGLFGFPWREPVLQAKCTQTEVAGTAELFGTVRVDRCHRSVPSPDCTCGIYATDEPTRSWLQRRYLADGVIVNGFVQLSGTVVVSGAVYRAEQAQIVGPLAISLPPRLWLRRLGARAGVSQAVRRVVQEEGRYTVRYSNGRRGVSVGEWHKQMSDALRRRYAVEVVGLVPLLPGS